MKLVESVSIAYSDIFDDVDKVTIKNLLAGIPTSNILELLGYFITQMHTKDTEGKRQAHFVKMWIGRLPTTIIPRINSFARRIQNERDIRFNFINNVSSLLLVEYALEFNNDLPRLDNLTPEQELNLFKAYLYCTEEWTKKQEGFEKQPETKGVEVLAQLLIRAQLPFYEILEFKDFVVQFVKAVHFFKYCEGDEIFKSYLEVFLKEHGLKSANEYLLHILSVYTRKFDELKTPFMLHVPDDHESVQDFLRQFALDPTDFRRQPDFLSLREKPLYEIDRNNFVFINLNFFIDKFFQGIQFAFAKSLIKHKATFNGKEIKKFDQFKSIYSTQFSEKVLFYQVMKYLFEKSGYIMKDGESLKLVLRDSEPDYYMRDKGKVYLIEFKDVLIDAQTKNSFDFPKIREKLFQKFVENEDGRPKGVSQLVNTIQNLSSPDFKKIDSIPSDAIIYPIIVYTDFSMNIAGINYLLNKEFRRLLKERGIKDGNIRNLTLIHFDTLVKYQDLFRDKKIKLNNLLNEYHDSTYRTAVELDKLTPFDKYINGKTENMEGRIPKILFDEAKNLLKE